MLRLILVFILATAAVPAHSATLNVTGSISDLLNPLATETISGFVEFSDPIPAGDGPLSLDDWSIVVGSNTLTPTSFFYVQPPFLNVTSGAIAGLGFNFVGAALFGGTGLTLIADGSGALLAFDVLGLRGVGEIGVEAVAAIPLPAALPLLLTGIGLVAWAGRRQRKQFGQNPTKY